MYITHIHTEFCRKKNKRRRVHINNTDRFVSYMTVEQEELKFRFGRPLQVAVRPMLRDRFCMSVALVYCGQTVGWIRIPLGTEVGLGPGDVVLDGDPAPSRKCMRQPPLFGPCLFRPMSIVAKRSPVSATAELLLPTQSTK